MSYPILREGRFLSIKGYMLLVADTCSDIHSMISLLALHSIYVHLKKDVISKRCWSYCNLSIALMANIIRITILALIINHLGKIVGHRFYYNHSCLVVFATTLASVILLKKLVQLLLKPIQT